MTSFYIPGNANLAYIHIPRTGLGIKHLIDNFLRPRFPQLYVDNWMINHPNLEMIHRNIPNCVTFTVIRNPWMRMWSFYRKIYLEGYWLDWNKQDRKYLKPFNEWLKDYADPSYEFEFPRWFNRWTQMIDFVEYKDLNGKKYSVNFILRAEQLFSDFEPICNYLNIPFDIPDISKYAETKEYRQHYSDKGAECVYEIYKRDILRYEYSF